jgi:8-oxo-dGTP diphosphatase
MKKLVHIAVGVIFDGAPTDVEKKTGRILIAKRADHQHQGGLWEFPGGKVEVGESVQVALQRELEEELGLQASIEDMQPLITIPFHYPDKSVLLDVWSVYKAANFNETDIQNISGSEFIGKEGQPLAWVDQAELANYQFPAANKAIIDALSLPNQIAISQDNNDPELILKQVANTLKNNTNIWLQLRAPSLEQLQYTQLAMKLYGICHEAGSKLIWNCPLDWYQIAFADGLHLSWKNIEATSLTSDTRPIPNHQWLSMVCHNLSELEAAQGLADYVLVSPVNKTATHPQMTPLTWAGFNVIAKQARIPCYALGGLNRSDIENTKLYGGQGIAGISCFVSEQKANIRNEEKSYES